MRDREELLDLELVDRIHSRDRSFVFPARQPSARDLLLRTRHCSNPAGPSVTCRTTPAARITLRTPAAKPSSRNTIIPHGEMPSQRSSSQPMPAPTRTPATSSVDKPKAAGDPRRIGGRTLTGLTVGRTVGLDMAEPFAETLQPRGERGLVGRWLIAITVCSRASSAMLSTPATVRRDRGHSAAPKAARTILSGSWSSQEIRTIWQLSGLKISRSDLICSGGAAAIGAWRSPARSLRWLSRAASAVR